MPHARASHADANGDRGELASHKLAGRIPKRLYGETPASDSGPLVLKAAGNVMGRGDRSRKVVNAQLGRRRVPCGKVRRD